MEDTIVARCSLKVKCQRLWRAQILLKYFFIIIHTRKKVTLGLVQCAGKQWKLIFCLYTLEKSSSVCSMNNSPQNEERSYMSSEVWMKENLIHFWDRCPHCANLPSTFHYWPHTVLCERGVK